MKKSFVMALCVALTVTAAAAVSYTHLDVYKRQGIFYGKGR